MASQTLNTLEDVVQKTYTIAAEASARDTNTSVWISPFGGFNIGEPITDPAVALAEMFSVELEDSKTREYIEKLIELECGKITEAVTDPTKPQKVDVYAYESTEVGGCEIMNPLYQFGLDDDIVPPINQIDFNGNGLGRVYSEMYRENMHVLWLSFGVPKYKNLSRFYRQAYNKKLVDVISSNDVTLSKKIGTIIGAAGGLAISLPLLPFIGAAKLYDELTAGVWGSNMYKYYELKPAMHNYYKVVNTILASLLVHMNLLPNQPIDKTDREQWKKDMEEDPNYAAKQNKNLAETDAPDTDNTLSPKDIELLQSFGVGGEKEGAYPHVLKVGPDIIRLLSLRHNRRRDRFKKLHGDDNNDLNGEFKYAEGAKEVEEAISAADTVYRAEVPDTEIDAQYDIKTGEYLIIEDDFKKEEVAKTDSLAALRAQAWNIGEKVTEAVEEGTEIVKEKMGDVGEAVKKFNNRVKASEQYGTAVDAAMGLNSFIGFRIEGGMDVNESISNSTTDSEVADRLKSMASSARSRNFSFADGNLGLGPIDAVIAAVNTMVSGVSSMVGLGGLTDMVTRGSGYIDIPKVWSDSSFSRSYTFDIKLQSPYPDELSIYQSLYLPLAMLMAASFPLGIGKNAYSAPFLIQAFSKGMFSIPLGIVSNLSITRGDPENGWTHSHLPTVIKTSITIEDLSPMMYLSMTDKNLLEVFRANTNMQDYYATLSGISLQDRSNARKQMLRKARIMKLIWVKNTFNLNSLAFKIGAGRAVTRYNRLFGRSRVGT